MCNLIFQRIGRIQRKCHRSYIIERPLQSSCFLSSSSFTFLFSLFLCCCCCCWYISSTDGGGRRTKWGIVTLYKSRTSQKKKDLTGTAAANQKTSAQDSPYNMHGWEADFIISLLSNDIYIRRWRSCAQYILLHWVCCCCFFGTYPAVYNSWPGELCVTTSEL